MSTVAIGDGEDRGHKPEEIKHHLYYCSLNSLFLLLVISKM